MSFLKFQPTTIQIKRARKHFTPLFCICTLIDITNKNSQRQNRDASISQSLQKHQTGNLFYNIKHYYSEQDLSHLHKIPLLARRGWANWFLLLLV
jgi:hypothetical protein